MIRKFSQWWMMHVTIPFGAIRLYVDDYREFKNAE